MNEFLASFLVGKTLSFDILIKEKKCQMQGSRLFEGEVKYRTAQQFPLSVKVFDSKEYHTLGKNH